MTESGDANGLVGIGELVDDVFPKTWVQTCIVHLIRHSLRATSPRREREQVARDLKPIPPSMPTRPARRSSASTRNGERASR
jgi:putative transposase